MADLYAAAVVGDAESIRASLRRLLEGPLEHDARGGQFRFVPLVQPVVEISRAVNYLEDGRTPLQIAAFHNHRQIVEMLLRAGADPLLVDEDLRTPKAWAQIAERAEIVDLLETAENATLAAEGLPHHTVDDHRFLALRRAWRHQQLRRPQQVQQQNVEQERQLRHAIHAYQMHLARLRDAVLEQPAPQGLPEPLGPVAAELPPPAEPIDPDPIAQGWQAHWEAALRGDGICRLPYQYILDSTRGFDAELRRGEGAFGTVFQGLDRAAGVYFAVKHLRAELQHGNRVFQREVEILRTFGHPNLIRLYGYAELAEEGGREWCLVYEFAPRSDVESNLRSDALARVLTSKRRLRVLAGVARGLSYLHNGSPDSPCFHRDVKSANVVLTWDFTPKLIDFGLSKFIPQVQRDADAHPERTTWTITDGGPFGTPGYMCPTAVRRGCFGEKSEVYSFGVVILEVLTGRLQSRDDDLIGTFMEDQQDLGTQLDNRGGEWQEEVQKSLVDLACECLGPYRGRVGMAHVVQQLRHLERDHGQVSVEEQGLALDLVEAHRALEQLRAQAEAQPVLEQNVQQCCICFENGFDASLGLVCPGQVAHFACNDCFSEFVRAQAGEELRLARQREGHVRCPVPGCEAQAWTDAAIAQHVTEIVFAQHLHVKTRLQEEALNRHFEERLQAEQLRWEVLGEVERHRQHICDRILTLACPRCGQAFIDFDNCFALTCSRCRCGFCAYCLQDCDRDAHAHVGQCRNGAGLFGNRRQFEDAQHQRRVRLLRNYIRGVPDRLHAEVLESVQQQLRELNIRL